mgnify:CR=1 FL=1
MGINKNRKECAWNGLFKGVIHLRELSGVISRQVGLGVKANTPATPMLL